MWFRAVIFVMLLALRVWPRGLSGPAEGELEPAVEMDLARAMRVLGCLLIPELAGSGAVRCVVRVEIL